MLIDNIFLESDKTNIKLSARVKWEDVDRPTQDVFFQLSTGSSAPFRKPLLSADPFVVGGLVPAIRHGEQRIKAEDPISPWLTDNLATLESYLAAWYRRRYRRPRNCSKTMPIESTEDCSNERLTNPRTACFFSGGVDSLYTLWRNLQSVPRSNPGSIKDIVFVHGFDMGGTVNGPKKTEFFERTAQQYKSFAERIGVNIILVATNVRHLDPDVQCWLEEFQGTAMSAVAHSLSGNISDVLIASTKDIRHLVPFGSHPLVEPHCSSFGLRLHHDGERTVRADKVAAIADWPDALTVLRVCFHGEGAKLNCGKCYKCIRTMLALLAVGKLSEAGTFEADDVSPEMITNFFELSSDTAYHARELIARMEKIERTDLSRALRKKVRQFNFRELVNFKKLVHALDRNRYTTHIVDALYSTKDRLSSFQAKIK